MRTPALAYVQAYEAKYGAGTRSLFGATMWDGFLLVAAGAEVAVAIGQPGTVEFRTALRDAMERVRRLPGAEAVFTLTPQDHSGAEANSQVMVEIHDGAYRRVP